MTESKCKEHRAFSDRTCQNAGEQALASNADEHAPGKQAIGDLIRGFQCFQAVSRVRACENPSPSSLKRDLISPAVLSGVVASGLTSDSVEAHVGTDLERAETLVSELKTVDRKTIVGAVLLTGVVAASVVARRPLNQAVVTTSAEKTVRFKTGTGSSGKFTYQESTLANGELLVDLHSVEAWQTGSKFRPLSGDPPAHPKTVGVWTRTEKYLKDLARSRGKENFQLRLDLVNEKLDRLLTKRFSVIQDTSYPFKTFRVPCLALGSTIVNPVPVSGFELPSVMSPSVVPSFRIQEEKTKTQRKAERKQRLKVLALSSRSLGQRPISYTNQILQQQPQDYSPLTPGPPTLLQRRILELPRRMTEVQTQVISVKTAEWSPNGTCYLGPDGNVWTVSPQTKEITKVENYPSHLRASLPSRDQFLFAPGSHFAYPGGHKEYIHTQTISVPTPPPPPPVRRRFCGRIFDPFGSGGWREDKCPRCQLQCTLPINRVMNYACNQEFD
jgi:hypothetical protein